MVGWTALIWGATAVAGALAFLRLVADAVLAMSYRLAQCERVARQAEARRQASEDESVVELQAG